VMYVSVCRGKTVMLDCGIHPGFSGMQSLPFFDEIDLDTVDVMLVTHFHLDHCAAVPYVCGHTTFKVSGREVAAEPLVSQGALWFLGEFRGFQQPVSFL
jgi:Cft2 family RNA processing exonuclease